MLLSGTAPTNRHPPGKCLDAKAPGWGQIFGANLRGCTGGMVMDCYVDYSHQLNILLDRKLCTKICRLHIYIYIYIHTGCPKKKTQHEIT